MWLLIDAGNTRVKWALHDGEAWVERGCIEHADIPKLIVAWQALPMPRRVLGCNVAGDTVGNMLNRTAEEIWRMGVEWLAPTPARQGVHTVYDPVQLGADRWASLMAARHLHEGDCLVVNVGTAMTVDALSAEGEFLGGIIVPGFQLMQQALAQGTADLGARPGNITAFPTTTADAISSGIMQALVGAVMRMAGEMKLSGHEASACLLSGGDGHLLRPYLNMRVVMVDNLALEGLLRIARE